MGVFPAAWLSCSARVLTNTSTESHFPAPPSNPPRPVDYQRFRKVQICPACPGRLKRHGEMVVFLGIVLDFDRDSGNNASTVPCHSQKSAIQIAAMKKAREPTSDSAAALQFRLRTVLYLVTAISGWFAVGVWFGPWGMVLIGLAIALSFWFLRLRARERGVVLVGGLIVATLMIVMLSSFINARREFGTPIKCHGNLRKIGLALHLYQQDYGSLPPPFVADASGKPTHSWRTFILPYLDMKPLHRQYDFSQPWDSAANRRLADYVISAFRCPFDCGSQHAETSYVAVNGPQTLWSETGSSAYGNIPDDRSATHVLVLEVEDSGILWSEPRDLDATILQRVPVDRRRILSPEHQASFYVLMSDGSVRPLELDPQALASILRGKNRAPPISEK